MARGDIKLVTPSQDNYSMRAIVGSGGAVTINAGEPTIGANANAASWTGAVKIAADGDPLTTSAHRFTGIAKSDSTDTASAAGYVDVFLPFPGNVYEAKSKAATDTDTQAEIDALKFKRVVFDLTSTAWTVDASAADSIVNGIVIVGGDYTKSTLKFIVSTAVSIFGNTISA